LFVGQHLRDFDTFNETVPKLAEQIGDLQINVVIHPAYKNKVVPHSCINVLADVNDKELRTLYQQATLLYLPLLDSTACNSILEAMACGLPIISSNVGGNGDYLKGTSNILLKNEDKDKEFIEETIALLNDGIRLLEMSISSRKKAIDLEWEKVANDINEFYGKLI